MAVTDSDEILITDPRNARVQKFSSEGAFVAQFGTAGTGDGQFDPSSGMRIAVSPGGDIFVANASRVQRFDRNGAFVSVYISQALRIIGLAFDPAGNLFVAGDVVIKKYNSDGILVAERSVDFVDGLAADNQGNVYVTSNFISGFLKLNNSLSTVMTSFWRPGLLTAAGIDTDGSGNVFVVSGDANQCTYAFGICHLGQMVWKLTPVSAGCSQDADCDCVPDQGDNCPTDGNTDQEDCGTGVGIACNEAPPRVVASQMLDQNWASVDSKPDLYLGQRSWQPEARDVETFDRFGKPLAYQLIVLDGSSLPPSPGTCGRVPMPPDVIGPPDPRATYQNAIFVSKWTKTLLSAEPNVIRMNVPKRLHNNSELRGPRGDRYWWTFATKDSLGRISIGDFRSVFVMPKNMPIQTQVAISPDDPTSLVGDRGQRIWSIANGAICTEELGELTDLRYCVGGPDANMFCDDDSECGSGGACTTVRYRNILDTCRFTKSLTRPKRIASNPVLQHTWDKRRPKTDTLFTNCNGDTCSSITNVYTFRRATPLCIVPEEDGFWEGLTVMLDAFQCGVLGFEFAVSLAHGVPMDTFPLAEACSSLISDITQQAPGEC